jgi:membrane protein implicated in regulation of membrane protease activity
MTEMIDLIKNYIRLQLNGARLEVVDYGVRIGAIVLFAFLLLLFFIPGFILAQMGLAEVIDGYEDLHGWGYLITAGLNLIGALLVFLLRRPLLSIFKNVLVGQLNKKEFRP